MIVTDLDMTLLRTDGTVSNHTISTLRRCRQKGIKIVFATARTLGGVQTFLDLIPCDAVICYNGAVIHDVDSDKTIFPIPAHSAKLLLRNLHNGFPHMTLMADINGTIYANFDVLSVWKNARTVLTDFTDLPVSPVEHILAGIDCDETVKKVRTYLPESISIRKLNTNFLLFMNKEATKMNALRVLGSKLHISPGEMLAFGDDFNDREMIQTVGLGVAVSNAIREVKAVADEITGSNDEDGVACFIDRIL